MVPFNAPTIQPRQTYINRQEVAKVVTKYCNEMTIRLTPNEFSELVNMYVERYVNTINKDAVIGLADLIVNSK